MKIALCIPHLPGIPKRDESLDRLMGELGYMKHDDDCGGFPVDYGYCGFINGSAGHVSVLRDREPNHVWARKMREFWLESKADFCLTLQDDALVSSRFWAELRAMLTYLPIGAALGLAAVHPAAPEFYRQGHRWYASHFLVGWGWGMWRDDLVAYHAWVAANAAREIKTTEDTLANEWLRESGRVAWHPLPTIVDHDTSIDSTYANDAHTHRRSRVTWRDTAALLEDEDYWLPSGAPPLVGNPQPSACWFCGRGQPRFRSDDTGCAICGDCILRCLGAVLGGSK